MASCMLRRFTVALVVVASLAAACGDSGSKATASPTTVAGGATTTKYDASKNTASDVGVTPTQITLGNVATLTGPIPGLFAASPAATDAFFQYINSQGGVFGRKLVMKGADDALDCNKNSSATSDLLPQVFAFVGSFTVVDNCSAKALTANPTVPDVHYALSDEAIAVPNSYSPQPTLPGFRTGQYLYFKKQFPDAISHVASLWVNTSPTTWANQKATMQSLGFTIVYERSTAPTETDFTADIIRMKSDGVQYLDLRNQDKTAIARILTAAAQQGFKPKVIDTNSAYDASFFKLLADPSVANGVIIDQPFAMFLGEDSDNTRSRPVPLVDEADALGRARRSLRHVQLGVGALFVQALQTAGPNPTRQGVLDALKNIHQFDANGFVAPADPGAKQPPTCLVFMKIQDSKFVRLLPTDKGYACDPTWGYFVKK